MMDLPYLARYLPHAAVFGSSSVINTLNAVPLFGGIDGRPSRLVAVDSVAGVDSVHPGRSLQIADAVRVRAIAWEHAPNFGSHVVARGSVTKAKSSLPRGLFGWKLGRVYAYAIDVMERDGRRGQSHHRARRRRIAAGRTACRGRDRYPTARAQHDCCHDCGQLRSRALVSRHLAC